MKEQIIEDLTWRHTCKMYDPTKKVSSEDMQIIKESLRLSASSINSQPWKFIVLETDKAKQRFSDTFANNFQFNQHHATKASHIILFAHNPFYKKEDFEKRAKVEVSSGHIPAENYEMFMGAFAFAQMNTNEEGYNGDWTKAQIYIALGNVLHTLARLKIDSTCMEGVDAQMINQEFKQELDGHSCNFALAIGYHDKEGDYNHGRPKARLDLEDVITTL